MTDIKTPETVQILFFIEDVEKCKRRGYPYKIVEYKEVEKK